jgi:hypothetical protein
LRILIRGLKGCRPRLRNSRAAKKFAPEIKR